MSAPYAGLFVSHGAPTLPIADIPARFGGAGNRAERRHRSFSYGSLSMAAYGFARSVSA